MSMTTKKPNGLMGEYIGIMFRRSTDWYSAMRYLVGKSTQKSDI